MIARTRLVKRALACSAVLPYALGVSVLVEIAELADVSVEGVVRVLTREPVSDAVKERVLAVLDELGPEQTRAVQRFALAALHDVLPRPGEPGEEAEAAPAEELPAVEQGGDAPLPAVRSDAVLAELGSVLGELAEAVRDLKVETLAERRERVDDLAVLIDLVTTGWQRVDGRLGRLERRLERLDAGPRSVPPPPPVAPPPPREEPAAAEDEHEDEPAPPTFLRRVRDGRAPMVAAMLVGGILGGLSVLQLVSGDAGADRLVARQTVGTAPGTAIRPASTTRPGPPAAAATTSSVLGTTTTQRPARTAATPAPAASRPAATTARPAPTTTAAAPATTAAAPRGFQPTRNWAWAPVPDADYYVVEFLRGGERFYRATPKQARLTLPDSLRFTPGSYRWVVRPGFGAPAAGDLGEPVVDSPFAVSPSR